MLAGVMLAHDDSTLQDIDDATARRAEALGLREIIRSRFRELPTRIVFSVVIGAAAYQLTLSTWLFYWFGAVALSQLVDTLVFRLIARRLKQRRMCKNCIRLASASVCQSTIIYSSLSLILWADGGAVARATAVLWSAGGAQHVLLHLHYIKPIFYCGLAGHGLYLISLPFWAIVGEAPRPNWDYFLILLGAFVFLAHLLKSFKQYNSASWTLRRAGAVAMLAKEEADRANDAKSKFLATISHELRTPMNAVLGMASLLKRGDLSNDQHRKVDTLIEGGETLMTILNDVLDMSKIEAGKLTIQPEDVDLRDLAQRTRELWAPRAEESGLDYSVHVEASGAERILVDPTRLRQILFNLVSNALKFTERGSVRVRIMCVPQDETTAQLRIAVEDTGVGIAPDVAPRLFAAFEQGDGSVTQRYGGTGLGLSISRRLAQMMGGDIEMTSRLGVGSTFTFVAPVALAASERTVA